MAAHEPRISIAIPAHNGRAQLERTLDSIAASSVDPASVEVVVADDGSNDGTADMLAGRDDPFRLSVHRGDWGSQSAATNEAIVHSSAPIVLLSAQDILFDEKLIEEHLAWHERFADEEVAVLGALPYPDDLDVTPFMFYLVNGGFQFAYYMIKDPLRVPPNFVYAPNLSLRRSTLDRVGLFDERLPYGCQETDLGIRLVDADVRIVYNARAVGSHNHPVELRGYFSRQEKAAAGRVRLQQKHPYHEGELPCWDVVVGSYLTYSQVQYELDLTEVERLEAAIAEHPRYCELWIRAWNHGEDLARFDEADHASLRVADRLFNAYARLLQFHWARGYLEEALSEYGEARVEVVLQARLSKLQASGATHRLVERRLDRHSLSPGKIAPAFESTRIVHGIETYADAVATLRRYFGQDTGVLNQQVLLVVPAGRLQREELDRLDELAEVVVCEEPDPGIADALARARAEIVSIVSARVEPAGIRPTLLAEKIFERMPQVAVIGGSVRELSGKVRYGSRLNGTGPEALFRTPGDAAGPQPVGTVVPEYLVVRRTWARRAMQGAAAGEPWIARLCSSVTASGGIVLHVPDCAAIERPGPAEARVAAVTL